MPRRRGGNLAISLFPFLSILACTIGVLTLMIAAMTLSQVATDQKDQDDQAAQQRLADYREAQDRTAKADQQLSHLRARVDQAKELASELEKLKQRLQAQDEAAAKALAAAKSAGDERARLLSEAQRLQKKLAELEAERARTLQEIQDLQAELARRKDVKQGVVQVHPGGSGTNIKGTFVECAGDRVLVHEGDVPAVVKRDDLAKDARFLGLLDRVAQSQDKTVIFLVRSDAVWTYQVAAGLARARYARHGKLPIHREGKLDLSLFKDMMK